MAESIQDGYQGTVECDSCEGTKNVFHYCIQCPGNICETCKLTHCNTRLTRNHRILPRTHPEVQQSRLTNKVYCDIHRDREYLMFCIQCKVSCCPTCISSEHSGHSFSDLGDEIARVEKEMNDIALDFEAYNIPEAEQDLKTITSAISDYKISVDKVKQSAEARIQQIHEDVDITGRQFMEALDEQMKNDLRQMEDGMKKVQDNLSEMKKTADVCRTAPADASLLMKRDKVKQMTETNPVPVTLPGCLNFNESTSCITVDMIGQFNQGKTMLICDRNLFQSSPQIKGIIEIKIVHTIHHVGSTICTTFDGQAWISDNNREQIRILDKKFNVKKTYDLGFNVKDMSLAKPMDTQYIDVIATTASKIIRIETNGMQTVLNISRRPRQSVSGICFHNDLGIVVGVSNPWKLKVYTLNAFCLLNEIERDEKGEAYFRAEIRRVRRSTTGECLVASGSEVICFSIDWKVNWRCKFPNEVWAFCCDLFNNILVVPRFTNQLTIISCTNGKIIQTADLKIADISDPLCLSVDREGLLWVGEERKVTIISYLKQ